MKIEDLKSNLDILQVAESLGIHPDPKTKRTHCPFHADKTPSLQFSEEKQIATCFSSNCTAGTMDVISLTEKKLNMNTGQAIKYLQENMMQSAIPTKTEKPTPNYKKDFEQMQSSLLSSSTARNYLESRHLDKTKLQVGYNAYKNAKHNYLKGCITFALKDCQGQTVSLYGRRVQDTTDNKHYYTPNRKGLYPSYPKKSTTKLILTESIIDAATLQSQAEIIKTHEILALYGTNGLTTEHIHAIQQLEKLEEIILMLDGDAAGKAATTKHGNYLKEICPNIKITTVEIPEGEDVNSLAQSHVPEIFTHLLKERKEINTSPNQHITPSNNQQITASNNQNITKSAHQKLNTSNPNNLIYTTQTATYYIKGGIRKEADSMKVTLVIEANNQKSRNKLDLYEDKQTEKVAREAAEKLHQNASNIEKDLNQLTDHLDDYRQQTQVQAETPNTKTIHLTTEEKQKAITFLKTPKLLEKINHLIGKSGVVGEENNRLFLYCIAASYKMPETLHALIQGTSGSGKTHLLATIMGFMPPEDTISLTRVTESSLYNYGKQELQNKLIGIEDYDGLEEKAELAFRELQSKGMITSSTSGKNEQTGEITGYIKTVYGPIASLSATTKGEIYEDNMSRCFIVAVDESQEQTLKIIQYQNNKAAGQINKEEEKGARTFLQQIIRLIKPYEVINPYANKIDLPKEAHKIRRLNDLFQSYVKQITVLNQYQRSRTSTGELITEKDDIATAINIMFDSIILKVDELDGSLRLFYEALKSYVKKKGENTSFTRREIRQETKVSNTQLHRNMKQLIDLEYIYQSGGYDNRGHQYKIQYWDDNEAMRHRIREDLKQQLEKL